MRLATIDLGGTSRVAIVRGDRVVPAHPGLSMRTLAADPTALADLRAWVDAQPPDAGLPLAGVTLAPVVTDPGAIYTVGLNYDGPGAAPRPERPLIYGKAPGSVAGHGATLAWDRSVTDDVDAEIELGVVMAANGRVFGYTCINDAVGRTCQTLLFWADD